MTGKFLPAFLALAALLLAADRASAASHSDAPLTKQDPQTNITDVYAFLGTKYNNAAIKVLNVVVHVRPLIEPGDGVLYDRFADDALYSIHIANPATGAQVCRYDFRFSPVGTTGTYKNLNTILSYGRGTEVGPILNVGDARHNFTQTYSLTKVTPNSSSVLATNRLTPPPNVGKRTTPLYNDATTGKAISGAQTFAALDLYTQQTVHGLGSGEAVFAGNREDGFYADVAGIFDLLDPRILGNDGRGQGGGGVDLFKGYNVLAYAIQIPVSQLPSLPYSVPALIGGDQTGVGVYASVSRPRTTLRSNTADPQGGGPFVQVNRMGNPLFNEVLVALRDKDNYNRALPTDDAARFATYATNPEVAVLINTVFGTSIPTTGRADLRAIYIPDVLRVNTTTEPVRLAGKVGFSRLGAFGGDVTMTGKPSGWPNGRRFGDDVVDIALTAVANGPTFTPPITPLGDNVNANDQVFHCVFPYSATPHAGTRHSKDSGINNE